MGIYKTNNLSKDFVNDISKCVNAYTNTYKSNSKITEYGTNNKVVGILTLGDLAQNDRELGKQEVCNTIENICDCNGHKNAE